MSRKMFYTVNKFEQGSYAYAEALIASFDTPRGAVDGRWQLLLLLCCIIRRCSLPLLLLLPALLQLATAQHKDPSPHIVVDNLPMVCPSGRSGVQVQDVTDSTSSYVCCGASTPVVRKTCR
jgi:hypothetical protein